MHWVVGGIILIGSYLASSTVEQCDLQLCGSKNVSFPFWIRNPSCGYPGFQIKCMEKDNGKSSGEVGLFLGAVVNGIETDFEILEINYTGSLIINSTDLKAMSCGVSYDDHASVLLELPLDGPYTISTVNRFVVIGCNGIGAFTVDATDDSKGGYCKSACLNQFDPKYCNCYGCCEAGIPGNRKMINFTGWGNCGYSTILDPLTWDIPKLEVGKYGRGHYGLKLEWGISNQNCTMAREAANYFCATEAECISVWDACTCKCLPGYEGNGYTNGSGCIGMISKFSKSRTVTGIIWSPLLSLPFRFPSLFDDENGCTDVDECSRGELNLCVNRSQGGICHNLFGSYNCSCAKDYIGDGFQNGTRCALRSSNNSLRSAVIGNLAECLPMFLAFLFKK